VSEDFIVITVVENDTEAELATAAARRGIDAVHRQTNFAAGSMDGMRGDRRGSWWACRRRGKRSSCSASRASPFRR
jgi:sugar lactone lactonase YvrE